MKVLFMGTPDFAVPCLDVLIKREDVEIAGVVTQPDKQKGRGHKVQPTSVKSFAQKHSIAVYQPQTLKNEAFLEELTMLAPELIVVVAYGKILPKYILNFPKYGCINVHASLLPKYRGAAPIHWSIIKGEKVTGVTTMMMDEGLDTGDMLLSERVEITKADDTGSLHDKLSVCGARVLGETLNLLMKGALIRTAQNNAAMTYAPMINKDMAVIDFSAPAVSVHNLIRGLCPFPGARTLANGQMLKIYKSKVVEGGHDKPSGYVTASKTGIRIACGTKDFVDLLEVQSEGGKRMNIESYLMGHEVKTGLMLGK